jgi:hypothetical protein
MEKRPTIPVFVIFLMIILSPIWLPVVVLILIFAFIYMVVRYLPIVKAMANKPSQHFTWKEVKLLTGASTADVLSTLSGFTNSGGLLARLRNKETLERLVRHYKMPIPKPGKLITEGNVIFYEFRYLYDGGGGSRWFLFDLGFRIFPKPVSV